MKTQMSFITLLSVLYLLTAGSVFAVAAKYGAKTEELVIGQGYCCVDGKLVSADKKSCERKKGLFSVDKNRLRNVCRSRKDGIEQMTPLLHTPVQAVAQAGYCCSKGEVQWSTEDRCKASRGFFSVSSRAAEEKCEKTIGYCCEMGSVRRLRQGDCQKADGSFFMERDDAERSCRETQGYCCIDGNVRPTTKGACDNLKGMFSISRKEAGKICQEMTGYCCREGKLRQMSRQQCGVAKGAFWEDKAEAKRRCTIARPGKHLSSVIHGDDEKEKVTHRKGGSGVRKRTRPPAALKPDLVVKNIGLTDRCFLEVEIKNQGGPMDPKAHARGKVHISAGSGHVLPPGKRSFQVVDPQRRLLKPGGTVLFRTPITVAGKKRTMVWLDTSHVIDESDENNNGGSQELVCRQGTMNIPAALAAAGPPGKIKGQVEPKIGRVVPKPDNPGPGSSDRPDLSRHTIQTAVLASGPAIEFLAPTQGQIVRPGEEITVRYRLTVPTDAGDIQFRLKDEEGEIVATTSNRYEPPTLSELVGVELEEVGTEPGGEGMETAETGTRRMGTTDFRWRLPDSLEPDRTYSIGAFKGDLRGQSGRMRVRSESDLLLPENIDGGVIRVSLAGGRRIRHPGETIRAYVDIVGGEDVPPFSPPDFYRQGLVGHGMFFHPINQGRDRMGQWFMQANIVSRSPDMRSITVDFTLPAAEDYGGYEENDEFVLTFLHEGMAGNSATFQVRPEGVEEGVSMLVLEPTDYTVWHVDTEQRISLRLFGIDDPNTLLYEFYLLNGGAEVRLPFNHLLGCDATSGVCSQTVAVSGDQAGRFEASGGRATLRVIAKRRKPGFVDGIEIARAERTVILGQPTVEVLSPRAGDHLTLFQNMELRLRVSGGARGPFNVTIQGRDRRYRLDTTIDCAVCPSPIVQEVSQPLMAWFGDGGPLFYSGLAPDSGGRFTIQVSSPTDSGLVQIGGDEPFMIHMPQLRVLRPDGTESIHSGERLDIQWELDVPPGTGSMYRTVDIVLYDEDQDTTRVLAELIPSDIPGENSVQGHFQWRVGDTIDRPGSLIDGMFTDLQPGHYTIRVNHHRFMGIHGSSPRLRIE